MKKGTTIFYCDNCGKEKRLLKKRQWCDCHNPPYEMWWGDKKSYKEMEARVKQSFSEIKISLKGQA